MAESNRRRLDISGQSFGMLTAESFSQMDAYGNALWLCRCECGNTKSVSLASLRRRLTKSCGCLRRQLIGGVNLTHGESHTPEYTVWYGMVRRCNVQTDVAYENYGGRGIKVCERWQESFEAFLDDMGKRPSQHHTLDRENNSLGYSKDNCRWATHTEQQQNTRRNINVTFNEETYCISEWSRRTGLHKEVIRGRLLRGWPVNLALTVPASNRQKLKTVLLQNQPR